MRYFLCLGTNLGDRPENLLKAISLMRDQGVQIRKASSIYETQPKDHPDQPWFLNQVIEVESSRPPVEMLSLLKEIESRMGRSQSFEKGPRIIDIDIILAEDRVIQSEELTIPHRRMFARNFVLIPLREISPDTHHPVLHRSIRELCRASKDTAIVKRIRESEHEK